MQAAVQTSKSVVRYWRISFMLASLFATPSVLGAEEPPPDLIRKVALRETETARAQSNYAYRQSVTIEELDDHGAKAGDYREVRDIIFSPKQQRTEQLIGKPRDGLRRLKLTEEDFRDIREVQPFLLTGEQAFL